MQVEEAVHLFFLRQQENNKIVKPEILISVFNKECHWREYSKSCDIQYLQGWKVVDIVIFCILLQLQLMYLIVNLATRAGLTI